MYIPKGFSFEGEEEIIMFMRNYSFATIITSKNGYPLATQLSFVIKKGEQLILSAHFALANEQARYIENEISLVIFSGPNAYISPTNYDAQDSVPTWDYLSVHAYGKAQIIRDEATKQQSFEEMIKFYEPEYLEQWHRLTDKFKTGMMKGTVAFELMINDLQGQQKISQNKNEVERKRIITKLEQSGSKNEIELANFIRKI